MLFTYQQLTVYFRKHGQDSQPFNETVSQWRSSAAQRPKWNESLVSFSHLKKMLINTIYLTFMTKIQPWNRAVWIYF